MSLLAGAAKLDITPPLGTPLEGYWYPRPAIGVLDPLFARALVLAAGDRIAAIVAVDICLLPWDWLAEPARMVERRSGVPQDCLFVACSHTHTGPATGRLFTRHEPPPWYRTFLQHRLADVVELARQNLAPARVGVGEALAPGLAFNRRLLGPDGRVFTYKPDTRPQGLRPAGPVDEHVRVLYAEHADGRPLAAVVNFGLHPDTIGGSRISADYPGILSTALAEKVGRGVEVLFLNGPCGDINHLDPARPGEPYAQEHARRIGRALAAQAYRALREVRWVEGGDLRAGREAVTLRVREPAPGQVEAARALAEGHRGEPTREVVRARGLLEVAARAGEPFTTWVTAVALEDVVLVGLPGEVFTAWGVLVQSRLPFRWTGIAELVNDYVGYLPTEEAFAQGGYETELCQGSFAEQDAGRKLVDAALRLLDRLKGRP